MKVHCPRCGSEALPASSENGGELYVAEELLGATEYYTEAYPYRCFHGCRLLFFTEVEIV
jgi:hypothetical protein